MHPLVRRQRLIWIALFIQAIPLEIELYKAERAEITKPYRIIVYDQV